MSQQPRKLFPGNSMREWFGAELRHWRTSRGLTQARLAELTHFSAEGERWPSTGMPEVCDTVPDAGGVLARMAPLMHNLRLRETGLGMRKVDTGVGAGRPFFSSRGRVILDVWTLRPERSKRGRRRGQRRIR